MSGKGNSTENPSSNYQTMPDGILSTQMTSTESHTRSLLKGVTWRMLATTTTVIVSWFVIGEVGTALQIGFIEVFAKIAIYYIHERIWAKIPV
jgi:uncharacterized membrane protein